MLPAMSISSGEQTGPGVRGRGDACPGAVRLHEAADGFLGRVRVPGGRLLPGPGRRARSGSRTAGRRRSRAHLPGQRPAARARPRVPGPSSPGCCSQPGCCRRWTMTASATSSPARCRDSTGAGDSTSHPGSPQLDEILCASKHSRGPERPLPDRPRRRPGGCGVPAARRHRGRRQRRRDGTRVAATGRCRHTGHRPGRRGPATGGAGSRGVPRGASRPRVGRLAGPGAARRTAAHGPVARGRRCRHRDHAAAQRRRRRTPTPLSWGWCGARTGGPPCRCSAASAG